MATLHQLRLGIDARPMAEGARQAKAATDQVAAGATGAVGAVARLQSGFSTAATAISAKALGLIGGISGLLYFGRGIIDEADQIGKLSQRIGISVENLGVLNQEAKLADVSLKSLATGVKTLAKLLDDANGGSKSAAATLADLGVTASQFNGDADASVHLLTKVADKFGSMEDGAEKTALSVKLLGRAGLDLIPMLDQGGEALERMFSKAKKDGGGLSKEFTDAAQAFNDSFTKLGHSVRELGPALTPILDFTATIVSSVAQIRTEANSTIVALLKDEALQLLVNPQKLHETAAALRAITEAMGIPGVSSSDPIQRRPRPSISDVVDLQPFGPPPDPATLRAWAKGLDDLKIQKIATDTRDAVTQFFALSDAISSLAIGAFIDALKQENDLLLLSDNEREIEIELLKAEKIARAAGVDLLEGEIDAIRREVEARQFWRDALAEDADKVADWTGVLSDSGPLMREVTKQINEAADAYEREQDAIEKAREALSGMVDDLRFENSLIGLSNDERERQTALRRFDQEAAKAGDGTEALRSEYEALLDVGEQLRKNKQLADDVAGALTTGLEDAIYSGKSLTDVLRSIGLELSKIGFRTFVSGPLQQLLSSQIFGSLSASGNVFSGGSVVPFASGGVLGGPTTFPMSDGRLGLAGEAGPEAILPLKRGADGKLGVRQDGGGRSVVVNMRVYANDADSFRRSQRQIVSDLNRAVGA